MDSGNVWHKAETLINRIPVSAACWPSYIATDKIDEHVNETAKLIRRGDDTSEHPFLCSRCSGHLYHIAICPDVLPAYEHELQDDVHSLLSHHPYCALRSLCMTEWCKISMHYPASFLLIFSSAGGAFHISWSKCCLSVCVCVCVCGC